MRRQSLRRLGQIVLSTRGDRLLRYYEVWVRGELGHKLLGYLGWSHRLVDERQVVRGEISAHELNAFLSHCSAAGLAVDRVRRVSAAGSPELAPY